MRDADATPMVLREMGSGRAVAANQAALDLLGCTVATFAEASGGVVRELAASGTQRLRRPDGRVIDVDVDSTAAWYAGGPAEILVVRLTSVSSLAAHGPLVAALVDALASWEDQAGDPVAALFVDVHADGDDLGMARTVAEVVGRRLGSAVREGDLLERVGNQSFVVVCRDVRGEIEAAGLAAELVDDLVRPVAVAGRAVVPVLAVGVALGGDPGMSTAELLTSPDNALAAARTQGRARHAAFSAAAAARSSRQAAASEALRHALHNGDLVVHYQPVVDLRHRAVSGVEALVRWVGPGGTLVPPDRFIPIAERSGLIVELGAWVLREACHYAASRPGLTVAVNVSAAQVRPDLVPLVVAALAEAGIPPERLCLELTETAFLDDPDRATDVFHELTRLGVRLSLDDFGTGYSSLLYLRKLPFDRLKIDRSFIRVVAESESDRDVVAAVLALARAVDVRTTAEGVETDEQARVLVDLGCEEAQGFLFGRPMAPDDCDAWLARP